MKFKIWITLFIIICHLIDSIIITVGAMKQLNTDKKSCVRAQPNEIFSIKDMAKDAKDTLSKNDRNPIAVTNAGMICFNWLWLESEKKI